ncbi:MAG: diguanylate cyclase [Tahibacter sp.]
MASAAALALNPAARFHDYVLDSWSIEHGLPQISVLSITQDPSGYLWIGTQNGIARFDGLRFTVYDRDSTGVDTTMASSALADRAGNLWFGTSRGALRYSEGRFQELSAGAEATAVLALAQDDRGQVLFATPRGVLADADGALRPKYLAGQSTYSLLVDQGRLWVGGEGRLWRIEGSQVETYTLPDPHLRVSHLVRQRDTLWLGTSAGLYRFDGGHISSAGLDAEFAQIGIESLGQDHDGNLWIGSVPRLLRRRPDGAVEVVAAEDFVHEPWIHAIFEDREGNLWLGSHTESLFRLWNGWAHRIDARDGLSNPFIWSLTRDPHGDIVLGTNAGVVVRHGDRMSELVPANALPNPSAYELHYAKNGSLWIGTRGGLAIWHDGAIHTPAALAPLNGQQINVLIERAPDDWWIGGMAGLYRYRQGQLQQIVLGTGSPLNRVRSIYSSAADEILVGTEGGVRRVRDGVVDVPDWAQPLEQRFVARIIQVRPGLIAVGTLDAGLGFVSGNSLLLLGSADGLPTTNSWTLDVLDDNLYVGTIIGVYRLPLDRLPDPERGIVHKIQPEVVLSSSGRERGSQIARCCNGGAASRSLIDGDGIWYASIVGALRLDTHAIVPPPLPPQVVVEALYHEGKAFDAGQTIELTEGRRDVEIQFTGLAFRDPRNLRFRYRLDGYDQDWRDADTRRSAFYTNLQPGNYRFHVQASLSERTRSSGDSTLQFRIAPRWHERATVRIAALAGLLALLGILLQRRTRRYRMRQEQLEFAIAERTAELARSNDRLREANRALSIESQTDALTGLYNRRSMLGRLHPALQTKRRDTSALLLLDLDNFKRINDRHGHGVGDRVLVQLARLLSAAARENDHVARWGGEEFLIALSDVDAQAALDIAERLRDTIAAHHFDDGQNTRLAVTCSIGFALHPVLVGSGGDWHTTLEIADSALYRIKREGRNGCMGLVAGPGARPELFDQHLTGRIEALVDIGALRWFGTVHAPRRSNVTPFPGSSA